jgi:hypothetical protein
MKAIKYRVSLDMFETMSQTKIKAKKGDSACEIHIALTEHGKIYKISNGCFATFTAKKADGNFIYDNCTIEGDNIVYDFSSSIDENGICQISACEGIVECEVTLYKSNGEQLTSPRFSLYIDSVVYNGEEIMSSPETDVLKELIVDANNAIKDMESALENMGEMNNAKIKSLPTTVTIDARNTPILTVSEYSELLDGKAHQILLIPDKDVVFDGEKSWYLFTDNYPLNLWNGSAWVTTKALSGCKFSAGQGIWLEVFLDKTYTEKHYVHLLNPPSETAAMQIVPANVTNNVSNTSIAPVASYSDTLTPLKDGQVHRVLLIPDKDVVFNGKEVIGITCPVTYYNGAEWVNAKNLTGCKYNAGQVILAEVLYESNGVDCTYFRILDPPTYNAIINNNLRVISATPIKDGSFWKVKIDDSIIPELKDGQIHRLLLILDSEMLFDGREWFVLEHSPLKWCVGGEWLYTKSLRNRKYNQGQGMLVEVKYLPSNYAWEYTHVLNVPPINYVLSETDKTEIAEAAASIIEGKDNILLKDTATGETYQLCVTNGKLRLGVIE